MSRTVFVTGANGFIGRKLCPLLEENGYQVRRGVHLRADSVPSSDPEVFASDIGPTTDWQGVLQNVDTVIHLAARVHVLHETEPDPLAAFRRVNTDGTIRLALSAAEQGVKRFIFVSTIGVHGNHTSNGQAFTEASPIVPHNAHTQSKWEAELALRQISEETDLELVIVRPPLAYGPGVPGNFLRLLKLTAAGFPLPLGNTKNRRSFISRTNLVSFLIHCMERPNAANQTVVISDGEDISTTDLIRKIACDLGLPSRVFSFPESILRFGTGMLGKQRVLDQLFGSLVVDSSRARNLLGWTPVVSMDEELAQTAAWFKETYRQKGR